MKTSEVMKTEAEDVQLSATTYQQCKADLMRVRNANRDVARDEHYFDWRYLGRPGGRPPIIVQARDGGGEMIGSLSLIPHSYWIDDAVATVGLLGDISVASAWRGKSIAQKMFQFLSGVGAVRELKCCIVLPNEPAARPLEKTGWVNASRLNRYIRIVGIERMLRRRSCPPWLARALSAVATPAYEWTCSVPASPVGGTCEAAVVDTVDSGFDGLWENLDKTGMVIACRDRAHLAWRFVAHPVRRYRFFVLRRGSELHGYVAFHVQDDHCYIDDVLCRREPGLAAHLLHAFVTNQRETGAATTIAVQINENFVSETALRRNGFVRRQDFQRVMMKPREDGDAGREFLNSRDWFMTIGDKDI